MCLGEQDAAGNVDKQGMERGDGDMKNDFLAGDELTSEHCNLGFKSLFLG